MNVEFKAWPSIPRAEPFRVTVTEKIDGTNACVIIKDGSIVGVQSRKRLITPEEDNYGFAAWVESNTNDLLNLGEGYHYGEWAGPGIQKNPHGLLEKRFFLFNTFRWNDQNPNRPKCCSVVPILFDGVLEPDTVKNILRGLKELSNENYDPEGVVVYYHATRSYTKHTIKNPNGKWCKS
jgi:hypothetical protein